MSRWFRFSLAVVLLISTVAFASAAQGVSKTHVSFLDKLREFFHLKSASKPALSPEGEHTLPESTDGVPINSTLVDNVNFSFNLTFVNVANISYDGRLFGREEGIDLDHDGLLEFIVQRFLPGGYENNVVVIRNAGPNSYAPAYLLTLNDSYLCNVGDFDGDGLSEMVFASQSSVYEDHKVHIRVMESNSSHSYPDHFSANITTDLGSNISVVLCADTYDADIDNNGKKEIAVVADYLTNGTAPRNGSLLLYESTGNDTYTLKYTYDGVPLPPVIATDDLNGNGKKELIFSEINKTGISPYLHVLELNGSRFTDIADFITPSHPADVDHFRHIEYLGDSDGDGRKEIIAGGQEQGYFGCLGQWRPCYILRYFVMEWNGTGGLKLIANFSNSPTRESILPYDSFLGVGDFDGDGKKESVVDQFKELRLYKSKGNDAFGIAWSSDYHPYYYEDLLVGDYDKDGRKEIIVSIHNYKIMVFEKAD